jgi:hypothetical protein
MPEMPAFSRRVLLGIAWAIFTGRKRSLRKDSLVATRRVPVKILGAEHIPHGGPGVVVLNHYFRPGFSAAWIGLVISANIPHDLIWVMSAAWTDTPTLKTRLQAAISVPLYPRLAWTYNFISMPPMPPRPHEVEARARAVRQILAAARQPNTLLAISPEGQDPSGGVLMHPHSGVGRMMYRLDQYGCRFYPIGLYEDDEAIILNFGSSFRLLLPEGLRRDEIDRRAADMVMDKIAAQLPEKLRGVYGG